MLDHGYRKGYECLSLPLKLGPSELYFNIQINVYNALLIHVAPITHIVLLILFNEKYLNIHFFTENKKFGSTRPKLEKCQH